MEKQRWEESQSERRRAEERRLAPEGRKVGSLKRRVRSHLARWEMAVVARSTFASEKLKTPHVWSTFGSWDVEKVHAVVARSTFPSQNVQNTPGSEHFWKLWCWKSARPVVARSTFPSQNVQNTPGSEHFWKLWCRKSARRCGAKHIWKSKPTKHTILGLEVDMSKKCRQLWPEAHVQVKSAINSGAIPNSLKASAILPSKVAYAIKNKTLMPQKLGAYAIKKHRSPEPFGISQSICTRSLRNLTRYLHRNPPEPHQASSPPKPSGTSQGLWTGTFRNLTSYLPRNPPEPHHTSSPRPSGTSSGSCTGNLPRYLPRNPPEPHHASSPIDPPQLHQVPAPKPSRT